jgi:hypothetical protein
MRGAARYGRPWPGTSSVAERSGTPRLCTSPGTVAGADFLHKGQGLGGTSDIRVAREAEERRKAAHTTAGRAAPKAGATTVRANPPNTELRRYYERSDLPVVILQYVLRPCRHPG